MKESSINRFFSKSPEEAKNVKEIIEKRFRTQEHLSFASERQKSKEELEIIDFCDKQTSAVAEEFGAESLEIGAKHIHIISEKEFVDFIKKRSGENTQIPDATFNLDRQAIIIKNTGGNLVKFINVLMHEMYHFKAFQSLQLDVVNISLRERRVGLSIGLREKASTAFLDLDEAITEYLVHITINRLIGNKENLPQIINQTIEDFGEPDIYTPTYLQEQLRFIDVLDEMQKKNPDKFKDGESVFKIFAEGYFAGKLLGLSKLIDKTFGKGSFVSFAKKGLPESRWER